MVSIDLKVFPAPPVGLPKAEKIFQNLPLYMREEVMCVVEYIRSQYDLAFNCLLETFERAVGELSQQASGPPTPESGDTVAITKLLSPRNTKCVECLIKPYDHSVSNWSACMALLGVGILRQYLSWDSSSRLDFVRKTLYPMIRKSGDLLVRYVLPCQFDLVELSLKGFGWSRQPEEELDMYTDLNFTPCEDRMRSVGWIFWKNPDRLWLMHLGLSQEYEMSCEHYEDDLGQVRPHLRLDGRPHLMEESVKRQDWERVFQKFGSPLAGIRHKETMALLMAIGQLSTCSCADIASILARPDAESTPASPKADDH